MTEVREKSILVRVIGSRLYHAFAFMLAARRFKVAYLFVVKLAN